jgi:hypothetical protein
MARRDRAAAAAAARRRGKLSVGRKAAGCQWRMANGGWRKARETPTANGRRRGGMLIRCTTQPRQLLSSGPDWSRRNSGDVGMAPMTRVTQMLMREEGRCAHRITLHLEPDKSKARRLPRNPHVADRSESLRLHSVIPMT